MAKSAFLNMFGRSPIQPLEAHMLKVEACVIELSAFFANVFTENWPVVETFQRQIVQLEHEADDIKRELRMHLPSSLFMPIARSDVLELLSVQDRLANTAKDIAGIVMGRRMIFPEMIKDKFLEFLNRCIDAAKQANQIIQELDELLETGFSGKELKLVQAMLENLYKIENDTDELQIQLRRLMFGLEITLPPVNIMFLYKVIEWTGELADRSRDIGDRLQILLAK